VTALVLLAACASIRPEFDAARKAAMAQPPPLADPWRPDVELQLSAPLVEELLDEAVAHQRALKTELTLGPASATPRLTLDEVTVRRSRRVDGLLLDLDLDGRVKWSLGPADGRLPASASARVEVVVDAVREEGDRWATSVRIVSVHELDVEVAGASVGLAELDREVRGWLDTALVQAPPIPLSVVGGEGLPLRAVRATGAGRGIRILGKSTAPLDVAVDRPRGMPDGGFRLAVHEESLLALARRASFENGAVGYQVVPEPSRLAFTPGGFELGLRLWRPVGRGWWRDYDVVGTTDVRRDRVHLEATEVTEAGNSKGAALADALAALGEGLILRTLADALNAAVPATVEQTVGGVDLVASVAEVGPGDGRTVVVDGVAEAH